MKKPLMLISNDWHIDPYNINIVTSIAKSFINKAVELGLSEAYIAGDVVDTRSSQKLSTITALIKIVGYAKEKGVTLVMIPGNHDKADYKSVDSWLDMLYHNPSVKVYSETGDIVVDGVNITLMPFFDEKIQVEEINKHEGGDVLIAHFELNGSTQNGIKAKGRAINKSMLKKWKKVYLGHYHTFHEVSKDIIHMPSLFQRNFSECPKKGFTLIYDDLSYEHIQSEFKQFKTIRLDIDEDVSKEIKEIIKSSSKEDINLRVEITGKGEKIKAFKKDKLVQAGVDVKYVYKELVIDDNDGVEIKKATSETLKSDFALFCERDELDFKKGEYYLNKVL